MQGGIAIAGLSPVIVPIFVSNVGCPHRCIFCDQSQFSDPVTPEDIPGIVHNFIAHCERADERRRLIAFYGGTFTGMEKGLLDAYIDTARLLVGQGVVHEAKASTRPDMISPEILRRLKDAGFVELEIGAQSMDDAVLSASGRGHSAEHTILASRLIRDSGMKLGIQIMPGLPGEDRKSFIRTVDALIRLNPDSARIYPTVVLGGTGLEKLYQSGQYTPLDLDEALLRSLYAYIRLISSGTTILRMGLPHSSGLRITAGPYHESFGFLVRSRAYRIMTQRLISQVGGDAQFLVHPGDIPELVGYKRQNIEDLSFSYSFDEHLPRGYIQAKGAAERGCVQLKDIIEYIL